MCYLIKQWFFLLGRTNVEHNSRIEIYNNCNHLYAVHKTQTDIHVFILKKKQ